MELGPIITALATARTSDDTSWIPASLQEYWNRTGSWSLRKKDITPSKLPEDSAPGEQLAEWVRAYAAHGEPMDRIRIRYYTPDTDKSWYVQGPLQLEERSGWDRALDVVIPLLANEQTRAALIHTVGKACQPVVAAMIAPTIEKTVELQVVATLERLLTPEPEANTTEVNGTPTDIILPGCGTVLGSTSRPSECGEQHLARLDAYPDDISG
jgi:hypothetical protein